MTILIYIIIVIIQFLLFQWATREDCDKDMGLFFSEIILSLVPFFGGMIALIGIGMMSNLKPPNIFRKNDNRNKI